MITIILMKHRHWFIIITLIIGILIIWNQFSFQWKQYKEQKTPYTFNSDDLEHITGFLLNWPKQTTRNNRSQTLSQNQSFLYGWIYDITYNNAINRLLDQSEKKDIKLIVENQKYQQYANDFWILSGKLYKENIMLYKDENLWLNYNHAKTFVWDTRRAIQTANLNRTSFLDNREHFFFSQNTKIQQDLINLFTLDLKKIENPKQITQEDYNKLLISISPNILICPLNCRKNIEHLLSQAQNRIWISAQYIVDPNILKILQQQQLLDLRIRTNDMDTNRALIRSLWKDHIIFEKNIYNHDKLLIIDEYLIIWSMNLSDNSLDNNREIWIILTDTNFIKQVEPLFQDQKFNVIKNDR